MCVCMHISGEEGRAHVCVCERREGGGCSVCVKGGRWRV